MKPISLYRLARKLLDLAALFWQQYSASVKAGTPVKTLRPVPSDVVEQWKAAKAELEAIFDQNRRNAHAIEDLLERLISLCETLRPVQTKKRPKARRKCG